MEPFVEDSVVHLCLKEMKGQLWRTLTPRKTWFTKHPVLMASSGLVVAADEKGV